MDDCMEAVEQAFMDLGREIAVQPASHPHLRLVGELQAVLPSQDHERSGPSLRRHGVAHLFGYRPLPHRFRVGPAGEGSGRARQEVRGSDPALQPGHGRAPGHHPGRVSCRRPGWAPPAPSASSTWPGRTPACWGSSARVSRREPISKPFPRCGNSRRSRSTARTPEHRRAFAAQWSEGPGVAGDRGGRSQGRRRAGSDIVMSGHQHQRADVQGRMAGRGHPRGFNIVNSDESVKRIELDEVTLRRADVIVINSRAQSEYAGHPDLLEAHRGRGVRLGQDSRVGQAHGRRGPGADARRRHHRVQEQRRHGHSVRRGGFPGAGTGQGGGLGREIPTDWFWRRSIHKGAPR